MTDIHLHIHGDGASISLPHDASFLDAIKKAGTGPGPIIRLEPDDEKVCLSCGSPESERSDEQCRAEQKSCCPERKMVHPEYRRGWDHGFASCLINVSPNDEKPRCKLPPLREELMDLVDDEELTDAVMKLLADRKKRRHGLNYKEGTASFVKAIEKRVVDVYKDAAPFVYGTATDRTPKVMVPRVSAADAAMDAIEEHVLFGDCFFLADLVRWMGHRGQSASPSIAYVEGRGYVEYVEGSKLDRIYQWTKRRHPHDASINTRGPTGAPKKSRVGQGKR